MARTQTQNRPRPGYWRSAHILVYQPADSDDQDSAPELEARFRTEAVAREWAESHLVVPLRLDRVDECIGDNARVLGTLRYELDY